MLLPNGCPGMSAMSVGLVGDRNQNETGFFTS
jgi:hypothetical protein